MAKSPIRKKQAVDADQPAPDLGTPEPSEVQGDPPQAPLAPTADSEPKRPHRELAVQPIALDRGDREALRDAHAKARDTSRPAAERAAATLATALMIGQKDKLDVLDRADRADELEREAADLQKRLQEAEERNRYLQSVVDSHVQALEKSKAELETAKEEIRQKNRDNVDLFDESVRARGEEEKLGKALAAAEAQIAALSPASCLALVAQALEQINEAVRAKPAAEPVTAEPIAISGEQISAEVGRVVVAVGSYSDAMSKVVAGVQDASLRAIAELRERLVEPTERAAKLAEEWPPQMVASVARMMEEQAKLVVASDGDRASKHAAILERLDALEQAVLAQLAAPKPAPSAVDPSAER